MKWEYSQNTITTDPGASDLESFLETSNQEIKRKQSGPVIPFLARCKARVCWVEVHLQVVFSSHSTTAAGFTGI
jgi:hypothetical protein